MASRLLSTLAGKLFDSPDEREAFVAALDENQRYAPCAIWCDLEQSPGVLDLPRLDPGVDWLPDWVLRLDTQQPGKHPLHEAGAFYSLDFSSLFAASPLLMIGKATRVLDMCAAPGGKSVFASRALGPQLLLSNEVIGKRLGILRHNLKRCRIPQAFTQRLDPGELATVGAESFDGVIVDAPCSGQSLLAKGIENPGCFHPATVKRNALRQRRILAAGAKTVAPGGWLLYSTCTFAPEENEKVLAWLLKRFEVFEAIEVPHLAPWRSPLVEFPVYRLYPHTGMGAGSFVGLLRRKGAAISQAELTPDLLAFPVPIEKRRLST